MNKFKERIFEMFNVESTEVELQETIAALNLSIAEKDEYITKLEETFKEASEMDSTYKAEFERVDKENKELLATIEKLNQDIAEVSKDAVIVEDLASLKASEILADCGHAPVETLEDAPEEEDILKTYKSLNGQELQEFFNKNKQAIFDKLKGK